MQKQKQKRISTLVGIIIIVATTVVFFGGVFAWQYFIVKSNVETVGLDLSEVEGWKTYTNTQYGFEFKYPDDSTIEISNAENPGDNSLYFIVLRSEKRPGAPISLQTPFHLAINDVDYNSSFLASSQNKQEVMVSGIKGKKIIVQQNVNQVNHTFVYIYLSKGSLNYIFQFVDPYTDSNYNLFNQILSTFKFINGVKAYSEMKKVLIADGWNVFSDKNFVSALDSVFPEIGDCGQGKDAVCSVSFKKGDAVKSFYVNQKIDPGTGLSLGWEVVGPVD
jgi:hypothetical protein